MKIIQLLLLHKSDKMLIAFCITKNKDGSRGWSFIWDDDDDDDDESDDDEYLSSVLEFAWKLQYTLNIFSIIYIYYLHPTFNL